MKKIKKVTALALAAALTASLAGCGATAATNAEAVGSGETAASGKVKEFTAFFGVPGSEINDDNEVQAKIAEITGAKCKETWLAGQTASEADGTLIAGGVYPDFIGGDQQLYEAGALIPLDEYWDDYPAIKNFWSEAQWDKIRREDGHVYWIPQFSRNNEKDMTTIPAEAFWIQTRVLKWAGYPTIKTMDQYFDLLESYQAANPTMEDGTPNIPYTILCDDWRYFCLENAPQFLAGYPNDGSVIVDPDTLKVVDYNTTDVAKIYFGKLNEEFQKGIVDPESFTQTYDEYIAKLSSGRVLGMIDQYWDFGYNVTDALKQSGLNAQGCDYVPLGLTVDENVKNQWFTDTEPVTDTSINVQNSGGLSITVSCKDIPGALQFVEDLLSPEVSTLRAWGVEGVDYEVGDDGIFYRTEEQRNQASDTAYKASHVCTYSYFPAYGGMSQDGINSASPSTQPGEFYDALSDDIKECFDAYGVKTYVDMLGHNAEPGPWYPMYSYSSTMTTDTAGGTAWTKMAELKHEYLPKVVMAGDFDAAWEEYLGVYATAKPENFLSEMQTELDKRLEMAAKYGIEVKPKA